MRFAVNLLLSLATLGLCLWLIWPSSSERAQMVQSFAGLDRDFLPYFIGYVALLALTHFARTWRWHFLLQPLGIRLDAMPLFCIQSASFLAILALPARLGEFVRPALLRAREPITVAEGLGTVAVERVIDGMLVSLVVFVAFAAHYGPDSDPWMMPTAVIALGGFLSALLFLLFALWKPGPTVQFALRVLLLQRFFPGIARLIEAKLYELIRGFTALKQAQPLRRFVAWSIFYWVVNGVSVWLLARGFDLGLSLEGAFATMALVAIGITLPNAPLLAGQFHAFTVFGLSVYVSAAIVESKGLAFAVLLHGTQVLWYAVVGALAFASPYVSFADILAASEVKEEA